MAKRAVLIGCNYPGTKAELKGCINDVWRMHKCLIEKYGFSDEDITVLIDTDRSYTQPTGKNIRCAISKMVRLAQPGDVLFVHYSGHGTRLPAEIGEDDDTGYDECIVPTDMNLITDEDFRDFVKRVPKGCRITIVSDSCHSGGLIEAAKEQIGDSTKEGGHNSSSGFKNLLNRTVEDTMKSRDIGEKHDLHHWDHSYVKNRSLPLSTLIEMLKLKTGKDDIEIGELRPTLFYIFGEDASPKVKNFVKFVLNKLKHGGGENEGHGGILGLVNNLAEGLLKHMLQIDDNEENENPVEPAEEAYATSTKHNIVDSGILLSGCQTDQTSADASPNGNSDEAYGAFSNAIQAIITGKDVVTNRELILKARKKLHRQGYTQKPGLYCSDNNVDAPFIC
ncbi:unnamed protein product [Trifolium pratense]|uniref:Uncharacterized protein n=1 Tax=Trifolium pratense TaxID=57577 RepID=A0ACB0KQU7_TRIPR|nr:unnamed protein product [Trifolium pratense]